MKKLRKIFTVSVMAITVLSMSFVVAPSVDAAQAGDLVMIEGNSAVYFLGADGKRHVFPNEATYFSWYADFSGVTTVSQSELDEFARGGNVTVRPGTKLITAPDETTVYAVEPNGTLRSIVSEENAINLYGADWSSNVVDIIPAFMSNYVTGSALSVGVYPEGTLVKATDAADVYMIDASGNARKFADGAAFLANNLKWDDIVETTMTVPAAGDTISGAESALTDVSQGGGGTGSIVDPEAGSGVTAGLSASTPAGGNVPTGVSVEMLAFNLTAANDGNVTVNTITLTSGSLGDGADIDDVTLFVDGVKYGNSKSISGSTDEATFNLATPIVIGAGTTKTVVVKAEIVAGGLDTYNLRVAMASDIVTNGSVVSGSFPIVGNTMSGVDATVAGLTLTSDQNDDSAQVGEDEVSVATFTIEEDGNEDAYLTSITLKNEGSIDPEDMGTFTLLYDDDEIATAMLVGDYVSFMFDELLIEEGQMEDFEVIADFEGGSANETLILAIDDDADVTALGKKGYPTTIDRAAFAQANSTTITLEAGDLVINFNSSAAPAKDIMDDTDNVILGRLEMTANAEGVTIDGLTFTVADATIDGDELDNFVMVGASGTSGSYDLDATFAGTTYTLTTDEEVYIAKGETVSFNIKVDVLDTADVDDKYKVVLDSGDIDAEGDDSEETIADITPSSVDSQSMTVVDSGLSHTILSLGDVTAIAGNDDMVKAYKGRFTAATASDVKVTKMIFEDDDGDAGTDFNESDVSLVSFIVDGEELETETDITANGTDENYVTFNEDFIVPAGTSVDFYVELKFASAAATNDAFQLRLKSATAKNSGDNTDTVTITPTVGYGSAPTITLATAGMIDISMDITESEANSDTFVVAGGTSDLLATIKFDAQDEAVIIENIEFRATAADADIFDDIAEVQLVDEDQTTILAVSDTFEVTGGAVVYTFDGWDYEIPEAGVKEIYIRVVTNEIGDGSEQVGDSGVLINFLIDSVEARGASGDEITVAGAAGPDSTDTDSEFEDTQITNSATNAGVVITSIVDDIVIDDLSGGSNVVGRFQFAIDTGNNTDASGNAAELNLTDMEFKITADVVSMGAVEVYWESDSSTKVTFGAGLATTTGAIDLSALNGISDTDVLVVKGYDISVDDNSYVQTSFLDLSADITWNDGTGGVDIVGVLLNYTDVTGTSVSK